MLQDVVLGEGRLHLVEVLAVTSGTHRYQVELPRPSRSREHLHHVGSRVQNLLHAVGVQQQVQLGGRDAHRGHHDPTQRDHPLQALEGPLQIGSVLILPFILFLIPTSFCSLQKG